MDIFSSILSNFICIEFNYFLDLHFSRNLNFMNLLFETKNSFKKQFPITIIKWIFFAVFFQMLCTEFNVRFKICISLHITLYDFTPYTRNEINQLENYII